MKIQPPTNQSSFKWTSRIIGLVWAILTGCFAILNIFVFVQPQWIGDTLSSSRAGYFGLYSYCVSEMNDFEFNCQGTWSDFHAILNIPFTIATLCVGVSILSIFACLTSFLLFLCCRTRRVYFICALLQTICSICLLVAVIVYPYGLDNDTVRAVCGADAHDFFLDTCQIRWAYILAIIGFVNVLILAILAFVLGMKQPASETMTEVTNPRHMMSKYGQLNEGFDDRTLTETSRSTAPLHKQWFFVHDGHAEKDIISCFQFHLVQCSLTRIDLSYGEKRRR